MRFIAAAVASVILCGCGPAPGPAVHETRLPDWYPRTIDELTTLNHQAEALFKNGQADQAAAKIKQAQSVSARLLAVRQPSLPAVEAASDLDDLYGRMLLASQNYGWAEMFFQKNRSRWKNWRPQTPQTTQRLQQAEEEIQEADRHIAN